MNPIIFKAVGQAPDFHVSEIAVDRRTIKDFSTLGEITFVHIAGHRTITVKNPFDEIYGQFLNT